MTLWVIQINLQHSRDATAELASVLAGRNKQVVLIQEPYLYRGEIKGLNLASYNTVVGSENDERPRSCIMISKDTRHSYDASRNQGVEHFIFRMTWRNFPQRKICLK